jgi:tetratricopeptide (TPR) repeat protein
MAFGGDSAESYYDEGLTASMKGAVREAIQHFERAIQMDPSYFPAYHQLAKCHLRLGDTKRAVGMLRQVALARPAMLAVRVDLGLALIDLRKTEEARQVLAEVLRTKPDHARAQLGLAQCAYLEGKWEEAMWLAESVANQGTPSFAALLVLGRSASRLNRVDVSAAALEQADRLIQQFIENSPDQPEGYYLRGEVQFSQEVYAKALEFYQAAMQRAKPDTHYAAYGEHFSALDILGRQGLCYQKLGATDQARVAGERLLSAVPDHPVGRLLTGG